MNLRLAVQNSRRTKRRGASLVEMLIYLALLTLFLITVINMVQSFTKAYRFMKAAQSIEQSAEASLERMTRDIRDAVGVDSANSILGSSPGKLILNTTDDAGTAVTEQFYLTGQKIRALEGAADIGPLTSSSVNVTSLIFQLITTAKSKAVKIEMTIESGVGVGFSSRSFYSTVVLRGSYPLQ